MSERLSRATPEPDTSVHDTGQVATAAAEVYDQFFLPALFAEWPPRLLDALSPHPGQHLLDVGCGTGVATRAAFERVAPGGRVTGVDINDGMLTVARRRGAAGDYVHAPAEELPFDDASFDGALSQFAMMFFSDRRAAIEEMQRVVRPGGRIAIAVWAALGDTPGYAALVELLDELFGETAARSLDVPYCLGEVDAFRAVFENAGISNLSVETREGTAHYPSLDAWMRTDVRGWTLSEMIDDDDFARLLEAATQRLAPFVQADGSVRFAAPAHIASFTVS